MKYKLPLVSILAIQPTPGIGDMIWSLPMLRGLSQALGPLTLITKARTFAREWLSFDPLIEKIIYATPKDFPRIFWQLKQESFSHAWILHRSTTHAMLPFFLNIPKRIGFGFKKQHYFLTKSGLPQSLYGAHLIDQMKNLLIQNNIPLGDQKPFLPSSIKDKVQSKIAHHKRPWIALGIGCSEFNRLWPLARFKILIQNLPGTIFISGGIKDKKAAQTLTLSPQTISSVNYSINQSFALMSLMDAYIGQDTGMLNVAASLGVPSLGLFGVTAPLTYVKNIYSVSPTQGGTMQDIRVKDVLNALEATGIL